jgi:cell division protein FtsN
MNPEIKGDVRPNVQSSGITNVQSSGTTDVLPIVNNNVQPSESSKMSIKNIIKKLSENKLYRYIAIGVIILAIVAFIYFKKSKKQIKPANKNQPTLPIPKQNNESSLFGSNEDHFILDTNGNPVKITVPLTNQPIPLPIPKQQPSQQDILMLQKQMQEKQMQQQMHHQQMQQQMHHQQMHHQQMHHQQRMHQNEGGSRHKLQHPESEINMSDNIDVDLEKIQENEDENVAQHNLTNSELAEINKKIEMMNSQNK